MENERTAEPWDDMVLDAKQERKLVKGLFQSVQMRHRLQLKLFNVCIIWERAAKYCKCTCLGYGLLLSRTFASPTGQVRWKKCKEEV